MLDKTEHQSAPVRKIVTACHVQAEAIVANSSPGATEEILTQSGVALTGWSRYYPFHVADSNLKFGKPLRLLLFGG